MFGFKKMFKFVVICEDADRYAALCQAAGVLLYDKKSDFNIMTNDDVHIVEYKIPLHGKAWNRFGQVLRGNGYKLMRISKIGRLYGLIKL